MAHLTKERLDQITKTANELIIILKRLITVDVNGKSIMSKEINEVTGILRLFTSPNRGMKPADGIIRAVTIITSEEYTTTITTTTTNPNHILLWTDLSFEYYKVKVAPGTTMVQATTLTCALAGMKAVCSGPPSCYNHNNAGRCVHTPLEDVKNAHCTGPMSVDCLLKESK